MAVASASVTVTPTSEVIPVLQPSPSKAASDTASEPSSSPAIYFSDGTPDRGDPSFASSPKDVDAQSPALMKSEEYRQLFRLPPEEVLVEDFNCAFQESILIQGHMYVFSNYICFYANIFGFETKKIISFHEVSSVRRAKTAGIFPNALEITSGGKKYFFGSFLSRDEAFKLINDIWLQHSNGAKAAAEQQDSVSMTSSQENGALTERVESFRHLIDEADFAHSSCSQIRNIDIPLVTDPKLPPNIEEDTATTSVSEMQDTVEENIVPVHITESSSTRKTSIWKEETYDAPKIPEAFTMVAESQFPIKVEEFFNLFFSDDAICFIKSFHKKCGDKEFRCSTWYPHDKFGYVRDVSFQHPIKIYFGAKFGACQETMKFRVYRDSHLFIETSQEVSDVPYGDYFNVEGLWDVESDADESNGSCRLRVYVNVAFSKRTVWKGKIVQSTLEECREAYANWISLAHELLKKRNIEIIQAKENPAPSVGENVQIHTERDAKEGECSERFCESNEPMRMSQMPDTFNVDQQMSHPLQGSYSVEAHTFTSWLRESLIKFCMALKSRGNFTLVLAIIFAVVFLMQLSILALLARPQHIHVHSPADYMNVGGRSPDAMAWLEKRFHHLKDEMYMIESRLERMRREHAVLKVQLEDLEHSGSRR